MRRITLTALLLLLAAPTLADPLVLRAARVLDVEQGRILEETDVVVAEGRIVSVGPRAPVPEAEVIDLGDVTLLPGLIDTHVHLGLSSTHFHPTIVTDGSALTALRAAANARATLRAGFTTVRDLGEPHPTRELPVVALAEAIAAGWVEGPEIVAAGHALGITGGHMDPGMAVGAAEGLLDLGPEQGIADGSDEVLRAARYQIKHGARVLKIAATAGVLSLEATVGAQQFSEEEMRVVVEEAARHGLEVAAHAHGTAGILAAIRAGVASIEHGSLLDDEAIALMKERGTFLVPTTALVELIELDGLPSIIQEKARDILPRAKASVEAAVEAGVRIAMGSDAPIIPHGRNALETEALVDRGMTPAAALRATTLDAADLLGLDDRGRIAQGLRADLVAVAGNPLDEIEALEEVRFVMQTGRVVLGP